MFCGILPALRSDRSPQNDHASFLRSARGEMAFQAPSSRSDNAEERAFGAISPSQWHSRIVAFLIGGLWSFKWFTQIGEKLFNAPNSTVMPFHLPLPAVLMRIFYQFLFNSAATA